MIFGLFLVILGSSIFIEHVFNIDIPIARICLALFIIYLGLKVLLGGFNIEGKFHKRLGPSEVVFGEADFVFPPGDGGKTEGGSTVYDVVFGKGTVDLSKVDLADGDVKVKLQTVFGETTAYVSASTPIRVNTSSVFAKVKLPNKDVNAFGQFSYESPSAAEASHVLQIEANAVFGRLIIEQVESK